MNKRQMVRVLPFAFFAASIVVLLLYYNSQIKNLKNEYVEVQSHVAAEAAETYSSKWRQIYQGLRTVARLPGVKKIDRYGINLDEDARISIQEQYNNLALNVEISEMYIVPVDLEPDQMDLHTKKLQEPIMTFDKLIVGKNADSKVAEEKSDEIEIYEYRLMKEQIAYFKNRFEFESQIKGLEYPMVSGPEVITCDNTHFSKKNPNDKDRSGIVISVPFYNIEGRLKGLISGVLLTRNLAQYISRPNYAIFSKKYNYLIGGSQPLFWELKQGSFHPLGPGADLIFSSQLQVVPEESDAQWTLLASEPDELFWSKVEVRNSKLNCLILFLLATLASIGLWWVLHLEAVKEKWMLERNLQLEVELDNKLKEVVGAQALLVQSSKLAELGEMAAGIAHEINNPLAIILSHLRRIKKRAVNFTDVMKIAEYEKVSDLVLTQSERIAKIVAGMRSFSRNAENDPLTQTDALVMVSDALSLCSERLKSAGIELVYQPESTPIYLMARPSQLSQVMVNLIFNAIDAVSSQPKKVIKIELKVNAAAFLEIRVTDSGTGVSKEIEEKIFRPFFTTKEVGKGTGLGLSISASIVTAHGGTLTLDRTKGESTFLISIPLSRE